MMMLPDWKGSRNPPAVREARGAVLSVEVHVAGPDDVTLAALRQDAEALEGQAGSPEIRRGGRGQEGSCAAAIDECYSYVWGGGGGGGGRRERDAKEGGTGGRWVDVEGTENTPCCSEDFTREGMTKGGRGGVPLCTAAYAHCGMFGSSRGGSRDGSWR